MVVVSRKGSLTWTRQELLLLGTWLPWTWVGHKWATAIQGALWAGEARGNFRMRFIMTTESQGAEKPSLREPTGQC